MSKRSEERAARLAAAAAALKAGTAPPEAAPDTPEAGEGMVVLLAPDDSSGCSFNEQNYEPDEDGFIEVPAEAVANLLCLGYTAP